MTLAFRPYVSLGPLRLGMTRDEVRTILSGAKVTEVERRNEGGGDAFPELGLHVHYSRDGTCEAIEAFAPSVPVIAGQTFVGMPFIEAYERARAIDPALETDPCGVTSHGYGFGLYASCPEKSPSQLVKAVIVFVRNYYKREASDRL